MTARTPSRGRYAGVPVAEHRGPDGRAVLYLRRRFIAPPESFALLQERAIEAGDRLDRLAAELLGNPDLGSRIADANGVLDPAELTAEVGRRIRIPLPDGFDEDAP